MMEDKKKARPEGPDEQEERIETAVGNSKMVITKEAVYFSVGAAKEPSGS